MKLNYLNCQDYNGRVIIYPTNTLKEMSFHDEIVEEIFEIILENKLTAEFSFKDEYIEKINKYFDNAEDDEEKMCQFMDVLQNFEGGYFLKYEYPIPHKVAEDLKSYSHSSYGYYATEYIFIKDLMKMETALCQIDDRVLRDVLKKEKEDI